MEGEINPHFGNHVLLSRVSGHVFDKDNEQKFLAFTSAVSSKAKLFGRSDRVTTCTRAFIGLSSELEPVTLAGLSLDKHLRRIGGAGSDKANAIDAARENELGQTRQVMSSIEASIEHTLLLRDKLTHVCANFAHSSFSKLISDGAIEAGVTARAYADTIKSDNPKMGDYDVRVADEYMATFASISTANTQLETLEEARERANMLNETITSTPPTGTPQRPPDLATQDHSSSAAAKKVAKKGTQYILNVPLSGGGIQQARLLDFGPIALASKYHHGKRIPISLRCAYTPIQHRDIQSAVNRLSQNLSDHYTHFDFGGIVGRLSMCQTIYALGGHVHVAYLSGGSVPLVRALHVGNHAQLSGRNSVYIPSTRFKQNQQVAVAALIHATSGTGSEILLDAAPMEGDWRVKFPISSNDALILGIREALTLLADLYAASQNMASFALWYYWGIHQALTVVGQADEAGVMRDLWRAATYVPSYGAVVPHFEGSASSTTALHLPQYAPNIMSVQRSVFTLALTSAASVCESDPGIEIDGETYPTLIVAPPSIFASDDLITGNNMTQEQYYTMVDGLAASLPTFLDHYIHRLCASLGPVSGVDHASTGFAAAIDGLRAVRSRHVVGPIMAPYFWIEPTGFSSGAMPAINQVLCGPICPIGAEKSFKLIPDLDLLNEDAFETVVQAKWQSCRTWPLMWHLMRRPEDGAALLRLNRGSTKAFVLTGRPSSDLQVGRSNATNLAWQWPTTGKSIPHPAEGIYTAGALQFSLKRSSDWFNLSNRQIAQYELGGDVSFSVTRPSYETHGPNHDVFFTLNTAEYFATKARARTNGAIRLCARISGPLATFAYEYPPVDAPILRVPTRLPADTAVRLDQPVHTPNPGPQSQGRLASKESAFNPATTQKSAGPPQITYSHEPPKGPSHTAQRAVIEVDPHAAERIEVHAAGAAEPGALTPDPRGDAEMHATPQQ